MPEAKDKKGYYLSIGIECHVQLKTATKLFSGADNDARQAEANSLINHIDLGLPGALPVLNEAAVELASRASFALGSKPQQFSKFDRKHYFYPDLPMGYQISQYDQPIILGGKVEFYVDDKLKTVNITRAHLEADAGKSIHPDGVNYSLVDLNRAGTPLLEIVSEPDMHSPSEARAYAQELYLLMRYADVSEANLYYGNMRFDVNVSVSKDETLGTRTETKNLNSFRSVERAVEHERNRQIALLEDNQAITQETRGWDDNKGVTYSMRTKENADDYRYMPDPDIPPVVLSDAYVKQIQQSLPPMPAHWRALLAKLELDKSLIESLLLAEVEFEAKNLAFISQLDSKMAKSISNLIVNLELPLRRKAEEQADSLSFIDDQKRYDLYDQAVGLFNDGRLSSSNQKRLISELLTMKSLAGSIEDYCTKNDLLQNSNSDELAQAVIAVIRDNPKAASDVRSGEQKAIGFLVGQVMKATHGQANPSVVQELLQTLLAKQAD